MRPVPLLITTVLTIMALYAPQPLLPILAREFAVSQSTVALLISLSLAPLALAPLCYGFLLEALAAETLLKVSVVLLGLSELVFATGGSFSVLMAVRIFQGIAIPAVLISMMTTLSTHTPQGKLQRIMAFYIASTIAGGFIGRLSSGFIASFIGWRPYFAVLGIVLCLSVFFIHNKCGPRQAATGKPDFRSVSLVLQREFLLLFLIAFCAFFVLASVMNFAPFRLQSVDKLAPEWLFGVLYTGYIAGIVSSLMAGRIIHLLQGEMRAIAAGFAFLGMALLLLLFPNIWVIILSLFILSAAMFLIHTIAANQVNQMAKGKKGIVNGLYVASYYAGGTMGSYIPGLVYEKYGWQAFLIFLMSMVVIGMLCATRLRLKRVGQKPLS